MFRGENRVERMKSGRIALTAGIFFVLLPLAACGPEKKVVSAPPPPPPPIVIPLKPYPPMGASPNLVIPMVNALGVRQTINTSISPAQTIWNLRSAYNVAALNCKDPRHAAIVEGYRAFSKTHKKGLATANKSVDNEFRQKHGARFVPPRESYMTQVYNFYAMPPTLPAFCDAALAMSLEAQTVKPADLTTFAARSLPAIDTVFETFYRSYEQYRVDLAAWEARYGALVATQTGTTSAQNLAQ